MIAALATLHPIILILWALFGAVAWALVALVILAAFHEARRKKYPTQSGLDTLEETLR